MSEQSTNVTTEPAETIPAIYGAICEVMEQVNHIEKNTTSDHGKFKFRGIDDVLNAVGPAFRARCVFAVPRLVSIERTPTTSKSGGGLMNTVVHVEYDFVSGADGSSITVGPIPGEAMDSGDKSTAKAMSVAYRIALIQLLAIPTGDPDPDHDVYERAADNPSPSRGGRQRQRRSEDTDPWANSNPELVRYYGGAIDATDSVDVLKTIWEEIVADTENRKMAATDRSELSVRIKRRLAAIPQDAAAEAPQDQ